MSYDTANCARVYKHDVRAKQTKVCDAERAGFQTPTHSSNYLKTDGQLIVQGRSAFSTPSLVASLAAFPRPSMDKMDKNVQAIYRCRYLRLQMIERR